MKRQINRLTTAKVRSATKDVCDGYGLWLQVSSFNTKSWLLRFRLDGKDDSMGLGPLNTTSLAKARERAQKARDLLAEGINPREARDAVRRQKKVEAAKAMTFKDCADAYVAANRGGWKNDKLPRSGPPRLMRRNAVNMSFRLRRLSSMTCLSLRSTLAWCGRSSSRSGTRRPRQHRACGAESSVC
jgi:hypothetical protein